MTKRALAEVFYSYVFVLLYGVSNYVLNEARPAPSRLPRSSLLSIAEKDYAPSVIAVMSRCQMKLHAFAHENYVSLSLSLSLLCSFDVA